MSRPRPFARSILLILLGILVMVPDPVGAGPAGCTPGEGGCVPTPAQCASGEYNGLWAGDAPDRLAVCLGGAGHIVQYSAGDVSTPCGAVIVADQVVLGSWDDPNRCFVDPVAAPEAAGSRFEGAARGPRGAVASPSALASAVGLAVLNRGGNAMDAAAATAFALGVTRPEWSGLGGGGYLVWRGRRGDVAALDFRTAAPAAAEPTSLEGPGLHRIGTGHRTVAVPGLVDGMARAIARYGRRSFANAVRPAELLARNGVVVTPEMANAYLWATWGALVPQLGAVPQPFPAAGDSARLRRYPAAAEIYLQNGVLPYPPGSVLVQTDMADTLKRLAEKGPREFYEGRIARLIAEEMERSRQAPEQGLMTFEDLASYRAIWQKPIRGSYRGRQVIVAPPSTSGGIVTLETLNILEGFDLRGMGHASAPALHLVAEAKKIAWADRMAYVGDPAYVDVPTRTLVSKAYAAKRRTEIRMDAAGTYEPGLGGPAPAPAPAMAGHTAHLSVVDAEGNAVALTTSIGALHGSAVVAPGTGFLLNDDLGNLGVPGSADQIEGGKRPVSSMSPTIVVRDGTPLLVVGGAGATFIPMGVISAIVGMVDFGMPIDLAVDAARIEAFECCQAFIEDARIPQEALAALESWGHELFRGGEYGPAPLVQAVGIDPPTRARSATSDPREERGAFAQR